MNSIQRGLFRFDGLMLISLLCSALSCVEIAAPSSDDDLVSQIGGPPVMIEPPQDRESRSLFFDARSGAYVLDLISQEVTQLCEASVAEVSADGERVLCVPESISSPLKLKDRLTGSESRIDDWTLTSSTTPMISASGNFFGTLIPKEDDIDHIAIYDAFALDPVASVKAVYFQGFMGDEHAVIHDPPEIWHFTAPDEETIPLGVRTVMPQDTPPYGVVYSSDDNFYFFPAGATVPEKKSEGDLIDLYQGRALLEEDGDPDEVRLKVYDIITDEEVYSMTVPAIRFDRELGLRMVSRHAAILEEQVSKRCGGDRVRYSLKSQLIDFKAGEIREIIETSEPHQVSANEKSSYAVVLTLDPCARPLGQAMLHHIKRDETKALPDPLKGNVFEGRVSAEGGFVALRGAEILWVIDPQTLDFRSVHTLEPISDGLRFD